MTVEATALPVQDNYPGYPGVTPGYLRWSPIVAGALAAAALSFILITFAAGIGLGVASTSPSWRDASAALAILSGIYLILQAVVSFGLGGYVAGRIGSPLAGPGTETETSDGLHGLAAWALAVVIGAALAAMIGGAALSRSTSATAETTRSTAEPLLSYEIDRLFRAPRRAANVYLTAERAEAGRILLTSSGHTGVTADDRTYLAQLVAASTGLPQADAERRVNTAIANAGTAIARSRRSTVILSFSLAAALLLGAAAAWAAACTGGRHRDGEVLPDWMTHADRFNRRRPAGFVP